MTRKKNKLKKTSSPKNEESPSRSQQKPPRPDKDRPRQEEPSLRFTPYAWAKLKYFCHAGDTEIGGFGLTEPDDPLLVVDFLTVRQKVSCVSVEFDDEAVAELFEDQIDAGRKPQQFARHWCHTHPGDCPSPSATDEDTFTRVFGGCDWAVMIILARGGQTYARLRFNAGPGGDVEIPVAVDYSAAFPGADHEAWGVEYEANVHPDIGTTATGAPAFGTGGTAKDGRNGFELWDGDDRVDPFGDLDPLPGAEAHDPQDLEQDRAQIEMLMDEYGVSEIGELRAILQHENEALLMHNF